jgi:hypothetical protein
MFIGAHLHTIPLARLVMYFIGVYSLFSVVLACRDRSVGTEMKERRKRRDENLYHRIPIFLADFLILDLHF